MKSTKPILLYFYWPEEDKDNSEAQEMIRRSALMESNIFSDEEVRRASLKFHCVKCNAKDDLGELVKKKYGISMIPKILFIDVRGKKIWQMSSTKTKPVHVAEKMEKIAKACEKLLEK